MVRTKVGVPPLHSVASMGMFEEEATRETAAGRKDKVVEKSIKSVEDVLSLFDFQSAHFFFLQVHCNQKYSEGPHLQWTLCSSLSYSSWWQQQLLTFSFQTR